jgi:hypothetical protein
MWRRDGAARTAMPQAQRADAESPASVSVYARAGPLERRRQSVRWRGTAAVASFASFAYTRARERDCGWWGATWSRCACMSAMPPPHGCPLTTFPVPAPGPAPQTAALGGEACDRAGSSHTALRCLHARARVFSAQGVHRLRSRNRVGARPAETWW